MKDRLARPCTVIDDEAITFRIEPFVVGDLLRGEKQMAYQFAILLGHAVDLGDMSLGYYERMHGRLRVDILEGDDRRVFKHDF